ncbi:GPP34 family phosphoprotein [Streptomyces sp. NPDC050560]|uniref:GOLPH3/VPS74 family protein n=1 Tax=Streptomyces sp. NPDC050560 TaxID=3365630 RepID=UPI0037B94499
MAQPLAQTLYLLTYSPDKKKFELLNIQGRGQLLRGGALAELVLGGRLGTEGGKALRLPGPPPEDPFLAEVWQDVPERPKGWLSLVHNKAHLAEAPVRGQLAEAGALTLQEGKRLKILGPSKVTVNDPEEVAALQRKVREAVLGAPDAAAIPTAELALAVLAVEVEVLSLFPHKDRREHAKALKAAAARFDTEVPGLRQAVRASFLSSRSVGGGWGAG